MFASDYADGIARADDAFAPSDAGLGERQDRRALGRDGAAAHGALAAARAAVRARPRTRSCALALRARARHAGALAAGSRVHRARPGRARRRHAARPARAAAVRAGARLRRRRRRGAGRRAFARAAPVDARRGPDRRRRWGCPPRCARRCASRWTDDELVLFRLAVHLLPARRPAGAVVLRARRGLAASRGCTWASSSPPPTRSRARSTASSSSTCPPRGCRCSSTS